MSDLHLKHAKHIFTEDHAKEMCELIDWMDNIQPMPFDWLDEEMLRFGKESAVLPSPEEYTLAEESYASRRVYMSKSEYLRVKNTYSTVHAAGDLVAVLPTSGNQKFWVAEIISRQLRQQGCTGDKYNIRWYQSKKEFGTYRPAFAKVVRNGKRANVEWTGEIWSQTILCRVQLTKARTLKSASQSAILEGLVAAAKHAELNADGDGKAADPNDQPAPQAEAKGEAVDESQPAANGQPERKRRGRPPKSRQAADSSDEEVSSEGQSESGEEEEVQNDAEESKAEEEAQTEEPRLILSPRGRGRGRPRGRGQGTGKGRGKGRGRGRGKGKGRE